MVCLAPVQGWGTPPVARRYQEALKNQSASTAAKVGANRSARGGYDVQISPQQKAAAQAAAAHGTAVTRSHLPNGAVARTQKSQISAEKQAQIDRNIKAIDRTPFNRNQAEQAAAGGVAATQARHAGQDMAAQKKASEHAKVEMSKVQQAHSARVEAARKSGGERGAQLEQSKIDAEKRKAASDAFAAAHPGQAKAISDRAAARRDAEAAPKN